MTAWRRCQRFSCPQLMTLDPLRPDDDTRRYCSEACERADARDIARTEREIITAEYLAGHPRRRRPPRGLAGYAQRAARIRI
jgi:hypothetical protein